MENTPSRPVYIKFNSNKEAVDTFINIEMIYFLAKLFWQRKIVE